MHSAIRLYTCSAEGCPLLSHGHRGVELHCSATEGGHLPRYYRGCFDLRDYSNSYPSIRWQLRGSVDRSDDRQEGGTTYLCRH
jgi:hypothetical protein